MNLGCSIVNEERPLSPNMNKNFRRDKLLLSKKLAYKIKQQVK